MSSFLIRISIALAVALQTADGPLIHSMDDLKVRDPKEKGRAESVEGKLGKAVEA